MSDDVEAYLNQTEYWLKARPVVEKIPVRDMSYDHRVRAARWLLDTAKPLLTIVESRTNEDVLAGDRGLADVLALVAQNPRTWMRNRPLFQALVKETEI